MSQELLGAATLELTANLLPLERALAAAQVKTEQAVARMQATMARAGTATAGVIREESALAAPMVRFGEVTQATGSRVDASMAKMRAETAALTAEQRKLAEGSGSMAGIIGAQARRHEEQTRKIGETTGALTRHGRAIEDAGKKTQAFGRTMTPMSALMTLIGVESVKAFVNFQREMTLIETQAGASHKQVGELDKGLKAMSHEVGRTPTELAMGMYHVVSAMNAVLPPTTRVSDELEIQRQAAIGAAVGHSGLEATTYALVSAMNTLHSEGGEAGKVMAELNAIVGAGDLRMQDLVSALSTGILPAARTFGVSMKSMGAALDTITQEGTPAQLAATRLRMGMTLLGAPTAEAAKKLEAIGVASSEVHARTKAMSEALEKAGLATSFLARDLRKPDGIMVALEDLKKHLEQSGLSHEEQSALIVRAFGGGRMGTSILQLYQRLPEIQKNYNNQLRITGHYSEGWQRTQETTQFKINQMKADIEKTGIQIGHDLLPVAMELLHGVEKIAHWFASLPDGVRKTIELVGLLTAALAPLAFVAGSLMRVAGVFAKGAGWALGGGAAARAGTAAAETAGMGTMILPAGSSTTGKAAGTAGRTVAAEAGLASGLGKAMLRGGMVGLAGYAGAEVLGAVTHSQQVASIGKDTALGAAIGTAIEPGLGTAIGGGLGLIAGSIKELVHGGRAGTPAGATAEHLTQGPGVPRLPSHTKADVATLVDKEEKELEDARQEVKRHTAHRKRGGLRKNIEQDDREKEWHDWLDQREKEIQERFQRKTGAAIGQGELEKVLKGKTIPSVNSMVRTFEHELEKLSPAGRKGMLGMIEKMGETLEREGRIPHGALKRMLDQLRPLLMQDFPKVFGASSAEASRQFQLQLHTQDMRNAIEGITGQIASRWDSHFKLLPISSHMSFSEVVKTAEKDLGKLQWEMHHGSQKARELAEAEYALLAPRFRHYLHDARHEVEGEFANIQKTTGHASHEAVEQAVRKFADLPPAMKREIERAGGEIGKGWAKIKHETNQDLRLLGVKGGIAAGGEPKAGAASGADVHRAGFAGGGLMQIGQPWDVGHDSVPLNVGGTPVVVAPGEQVAVFNRHQLPFVNAGLQMQGFGGLEGLFSSVQTPHHMAAGGLLNQMVGKANQISRQHFPYVWGGGHGSFDGPYDCSGAVSAVLHAAGLLPRPETSGELMNFGAAGPGKVTIYANPQHTFMSLMGRFFGTHGSSGAEWYAGGPRPGFAIRHVPMSGDEVLGGFVKEPKMPDSGYLGQVERGATKKLTSAANAYIARNSFGPMGAGTSEAHGMFNRGQLEAIWRQAGGAADKAHLMGAIALAESAGNPQSVGVATSGGHAEGLWQIMMPTNAGAVHGNVFDPTVNARAAATILKSQGLGAWEAYTNGSYRKFMARGGLLAKGGMAKAGGSLQRRYADVTAFLRGLWKSAAPYYGQAGHAMPRPTYTSGKDGLFVGVDQTPGTRAGHRQLFIPDWIATSGIEGEKSPGLRQHDPQMMQLMVHEWAHEFQRLPALNKAQQKAPHGVEVAEGGAQAFANTFAPAILAKLGFHAVHDISYAHDTQWVSQHLGPRWIAKGQFGMAQGGLVPDSAAGVKGALGPPREAQHHGYHRFLEWAKSKLRREGKPTGHPPDRVREPEVFQRMVEGYLGPGYMRSHAGVVPWYGMENTQPGVWWGKWQRGETYARGGLIPRVVPPPPPPHMARAARAPGKEQGQRELQAFHSLYEHQPPRPTPHDEQMVQRQAARTFSILRGQHAWPGWAHQPGLNIPRGSWGSPAFEEAGSINFPWNFVYHMTHAPSRFEPLTQDEALSAIPHEMAHAFQKPGLRRWEAEGGASAFAHYWGPKALGLFATPPPNYRGFVSQVLGRHGLPWVLHGQWAGGAGSAGQVGMNFARGGLVPTQYFQPGGKHKATKGHTERPKGVHHVKRAAKPRKVDLSHLITTLSKDPGMEGIGGEIGPVEATANLLGTQQEALASLNSNPASILPRDMGVLGPTLLPEENIIVPPPMRVPLAQRRLQRAQGAHGESDQLSYQGDLLSYIEGLDDHRLLTDADAAVLAKFAGKVQPHGWQGNVRIKGAIQGLDFPPHHPIFQGQMEVLTEQLRYEKALGNLLKRERSKADALVKVRQRRLARLRKLAEVAQRRLHGMKRRLEEMTTARLHKKLSEAQRKEHIGGLVEDAEEHRHAIRENLTSETELPKKERNENLIHSLRHEERGIGDYISALHKHSGAGAVSSAQEALLRDHIKHEMQPVEGSLQFLGGNAKAVGHGGEIGKVTGQVQSLQTGATEITQKLQDTEKNVIPQIELSIEGIKTSLDEAAEQAPPAHRPGTSAEKPGEAELNALLKQQLEQEKMGRAIAEAQFKVLDRYLKLPPFGGHFAEGGLVPGPIGAPRTIIAHGGELVSKAGAAPNVHVHFADGMGWLKDFMRVEVRQSTREMSRAAGTPLPSRGGGGFG